MKPSGHICGRLKPEFMPTDRSPQVCLSALRVRIVVSSHHRKEILMIKLVTKTVLAIACNRCGFRPSDAARAGRRCRCQVQGG